MSIEHYLAIRQGVRQPRHMMARTIPALESADPWDGHNGAVSELRRREAAGVRAFPEVCDGESLLDRKIALAEKMLDSCDLCPHHCLVNRNRGETGYCGVASEAAVHWEGILMGEEAELIPSHEVFLSGCTMRCAFCYSHEHITRPMSGTKMTPLRLAACVEQRQNEGATNLNLVGGEPTVHIAYILKMLKQADVRVPVIWNSNMYATPEAMALLDGVVDLYLGDIHFGNDDCARRLGRIPNYLPSITGAFDAAVESGAGVIIRHLVMPGHLECCTRPALQWAATHFPTTLLHLMFQYVPDFRAVGDPVLGRPLSADEIAEAGAMANEIGVRLYTKPAPEGFDTKTLCNSGGIGETVDILVHSDGRVAFTRLLDSMAPIAKALNGPAVRIANHASTMEG